MELSTHTSTPVVREGTPGEVDSRRKASLAVKIFAVVVPLISFTLRNWKVLIVALMGHKIHTVQIAEMVGTLIGLLLFPGIIVLLFQTGKRFRTPSKRWSIFLYGSLFMLVVRVLNAIPID